MKRIEFQFAVLMFAAIAAAGLIGCGKGAHVGIQRPAVHAGAKPAPEESFELILETFRRGVEGVDIGFVMPREGGHSMMTGRNEVTHELIRPAKEGDPYKAIITVDSQSRYSIQRTAGGESDSVDDRQGDQQGSRSALDGEKDPVSIDILDPDLAGASAKNSGRRDVPKAGETSIDRSSNEDKKSYELVYKDGRWTLTTKLDKETEQSIENAFDQALKTQI